MTSPERFRIKRGGDPFTKADFDESPAWSEHYDYDELDLIASWGVERSLIAAQFKSMDTGGAHPNYTILDLDHLPHDHMRIFLKAEFTHSSGLILHGYVTNANAYCIGIFVGGENFLFSSHPLMRSMCLSKQREIEKILGISELFPLSYNTNFVGPDGERICGVFVTGY